jgi:hypothetical protein
VSGIGESGNEAFCSIKYGFFFHWAETHLFLKQDTAPRIYSEIDGNYAVCNSEQILADFFVYFVL